MKLTVIVAYGGGTIYHHRQGSARRGGWGGIVGGIIAGAIIAHNYRHAYRPRYYAPRPRVYHHHHYQGALNPVMRRPPECTLNAFLRQRGDVSPLRLTPTAARRVIPADLQNKSKQ